MCGGRLAAQVLRLGRLENTLGNHAVQVHFEVDVNYGRTGVIPMDTVAAGRAGGVKGVITGMPI